MAFLLFYVGTKSSVGLSLDNFSVEAVFFFHMTSKVIEEVGRANLF